MHLGSIDIDNFDATSIESFDNQTDPRLAEKNLLANRDAKIEGRSYSASGLGWVYRDSDSISNHGRRASEFAKRAMDLTLSASAVLFLLPVFLLLAFAVATTSRGPIFFIQHRPGKDGVMFPMLKFRSMQQDLGDSSGVTQTVKNDMRLTPIGSFIRKTSLDELPQLLNVLAGHMSLVGPRPHPLGMKAAGIDYRSLVPYYNLRHAVRPGLSGWAQVNGLRGPTTEEDLAVARIDHDLAYIQNRSFALDAKIIFRTLRQELAGGSGS